MKKVRLSGLDAIRGITLLSMIIYHTCWDLNYLFGVNIEGYGSVWSYIWQQSICWTFIFLSGFCWSLGRNHLKRGITVFVAGLLITVVTLLAMPDERVVYGVLTLIGSCMLLMIPLEKLLQRVPAGIGFFVSMLLFLLLRNVNQRELGFEGMVITKLPDHLYANMFTTYLGFPEQDFYSTDYFSLLPWCYLFIAGYFAYRLTQSHKLLERLFSWKMKAMQPLAAIGRYSLPLYLLHQPIVFGILWIVFRLI